MCGVRSESSPCSFTYVHACSSDLIEDRLERRSGRRRGARFAVHTRWLSAWYRSRRSSNVLYSTLRLVNARRSRAAGRPWPPVPHGRRGAGHAPALLDHVGQLVREQSSAVGRREIGRAGAEVDVAPVGERLGAERFVQRCRLDARVHANPPEVGPERTFHPGADRCVERRTLSSATTNAPGELIVDIAAGRSQHGVVHRIRPADVGGRLAAGERNAGRCPEGPEHSIGDVIRLTFERIVARADDQFRLDRDAARAAAWWHPDPVDASSRRPHRLPIRPERENARSPSLSFDSAREYPTADSSVRGTAGQVSMTASRSCSLTYRPSARAGTVVPSNGTRSLVWLRSSARTITAPG